MKILQLTGLLLAAGSFTAATLVAVKSSRAASEPSSAAAPREPGILRYATDAPQLAALKIKTAEELPVPLAEPLRLILARFQLMAIEAP